MAAAHVLLAGSPAVRHAGSLLLIVGDQNNPTGRVRTGLPYKHNHLNRGGWRDPASINPRAIQHDLNHPTPGRC